MLGEKDSKYPSREESIKVEAYYKALLCKLTYEEATSKLVPIMHVIDYLKAVSSKLRTSLAQFPDRISPRITHESDEETVHTLLLREIESITESIDRLESLDELKSNIMQESQASPVLKSGKVTSKHKVDKE